MSAPLQTDRIDISCSTLTDLQWGIYPFKETITDILTVFVYIYVYGNAILN